jgi:hypothetical protein
MLFPQPTRNEVVKIDFAFTPSQTNQHFHNLEALVGQNKVPALCSGDTFKFSYRFTVDYFGQIEAALKAVAAILQDRTVGIEATVSEFSYGESLILKVGAALRDVQIAMEKRRQPPPKKPSLWQRLIARWQS